MGALVAPLGAELSFPVARSSSKPISAGPKGSLIALGTGVAKRVGPSSR